MGSELDSEPLPLSSVGGAGYLAVEEPLSPAGSDEAPHVQAFMYHMPAPESGEANAEQVVHFLVSHGYLLSALELLVEAERAEIESDISVGQLLGPFFNNPDNFPAEELAKCSGDDEFTLAVQLAERDTQLEETSGKAALAEYNLRLAQEDLQGLEAKLLKAAAASKAQHSTTDSAAAEGTRAPDAGSAEITSQDKNIAQDEREELNTAIRLYLNAFGYRLTALTFGDEAAGSFSETNPPGGEMAPLMHLKAFREVHRLREVAESATSECEQMERELRSAQQRVEELQAALAHTETENQCMRSDIELLNEQLQAMHQSKEEDQEHVGSGGSDDADRPTSGSAATTTSPSDLSYVWRGGTIHAVEALRAISAVLPKIVPSVLINAREELVPIFISIIQEHPDAPARSALTKALFNIIKKPDDSQRRMILEACRDLATRIGPKRTAEELLPQCWQQMNDKYPERRVLVAATCGQLAANVAADMRQSVILGMLGQMADDPKSAVRASVAENLASLLPHLEGLGKYDQVEELCFQLALDLGEEVQEAALGVLLPAVVDWARSSGRVCESLIPGILQRMLSVLEGAQAVQQLPEFGPGLRIPGPIQQDQLRVLLQMWAELLPELQVAALEARPGWAMAWSAAGAAGGESASNSSFPGYNGRRSSGSADGTDRDAPPDSPGSTSARGAGAASNPFDQGEGAQPADDATNPFSRASSEGSAAADTAFNPFEEPMPGSSTGSTAPYNPFEDGPSSEGEARRGRSKRDAKPTAVTMPTQRAAARPAFAVWANEEELHAEWELIEWFVATGLTQLLRVFSMVYPSESSEMLRHAFCETMRHTCLAFGHHFTGDVIVPLFIGAIAAPPVTPPAAHIAQMTATLCPCNAHGKRVGRTTLLPILLGGVLPCAGDEALTEYLMLLLEEGGGGGGGPPWGLRHRGELLPVLQFVGAIEDMQLEMLKVMHLLVASPAELSRQAAALLATALACRLGEEAVERRLLPALARLTEDKNRKVRLAVVTAISEVSRRHCTDNPLLAAKLQPLLDTLVMEGGPQHEVQMAVLAALAEGMPMASTQQVEFLLQKILWLLASIAQRQTCGKPPSQLTETASAVFDCLRMIDGCDTSASSHRVQLHMVSALTCLQREAELLDASRRETLTSMVRDHSVSTPAMDVPDETPMLQTFTEPTSQTVVTVNTSSNGPSPNYLSFKQGFARQ